MRQAMYIYGKSMKWMALKILALFLSVALPSVALAAQPTPWGLGFQEAASPIAREMHDFHDVLLVIISLITVVVFALLLYVVWRYRSAKNPVPSKTTHNTVLEVIWTGIPVIILMVIVGQSLHLLRFIDTIEEADVTIKVTGYQWYWGYEYPDHGPISFDSYMIPDEEITEDQVRLLSVDQRVVVPVGKTIRFLITAGDVLHSFAIPALGVKMDAIPGRLNETWTRVEKPGIYYGQCSEICGTGHAYMPIAIEAVSEEAFAAWVKAQGGKIPSDDAPLASSNVTTLAGSAEQGASL